jgi:hypothetical protein
VIVFCRRSPVSALAYCPLNGCTRPSSPIEELGRTCLRAGDPARDVLSARQILISPPVVARDHERDIVASTSLQELSGCLRHHETGAHQERRTLDRVDSDCPVGRLLHNRSPGKIDRLQPTRRIDQVEPGRRRTVLERDPLRITRLVGQGLLQRSSENYLLGPLSKSPGSHREGAHDIDHDSDRRNLSHPGNTNKASVHPKMVSNVHPSRLPGRRGEAIPELRDSRTFCRGARRIRRAPLRFSCSAP